MLSMMDLRSKNQKNSDHHQLSATFPGFTAINRRRRVICKNCDLPVGYTDVEQAYLGSKNPQTPQERQINSDEGNFKSVMIPLPINISINPNRQGSFKIPESENPYMTWILKDSEGSVFNVDEIMCDGCGTSLGARVTALEQHPHSYDMKICQPVEHSEEKFQFYCFSIGRVKIEPLFRNIGMKELSSTYYGGECYFDEIQTIEDSDIYSNNSKCWVRPQERVMIKNTNSSEEKRNCSWPVMLMDLVRQNELPEGTLSINLE